MITPWDLLIVFAVAELVFAVLVLTIILKFSKTPLGKRLFALATVFIVQSILSAISYYKWKIDGYGPSIALPLLGIQVLILLGIIILYTFVKI